jgi:hypothetical protein
VKTSFRAQVGQTIIQSSFATEPKTFSYVSTGTLGSKGGYYPGEVFYSRKDMETFIQALREAADTAFPNEQKGEIA